MTRKRQPKAQSPSPLARVWEAVECLVMNGQYAVDRKRGRDALPALITLESALPVLMESHHRACRHMDDQKHPRRGTSWQDCTDCRALLEGK